MKMRYLLLLLLAVISWAGDKKTPSDQDLALQGDRDALKRIDLECADKKPISCYSSAYVRHAGPKQLHDPIAARADFLKSCDLGFLQGCATTGLLLHQDGKSDAAVAYNRKACDGGNVNGCSNLALQYVTGKGLPKDFTVARAMYKKACDAGFGEACFNLGVMYAQGEGGAPDKSQAMLLYDQACKKFSYPLACLAWAKGIIRDSINEEERNHAYWMTRDLCFDQAADSCFEMVALYAEGRGEPEDIDRVVAIADEQCRKGKGTYCTNLGVIYAKGRGLPQDAKKAVENYKRGCDMGEASSCFSLAVRLKSGDGVNRDVAVAEQLFKKACKDGYQPACDSPDKTRATTEPDPRMDCLAGNFLACRKLGGQMATGDDLANVPKDLKSAMAMFTRGCELNDAPSCYGLAFSQRESGNLPGYFKAVNRACELGDVRGCYDTAHAYLHATGVAADPAKAATLYEGACMKGNMAACNNLGDMYEYGKGVRQDFARAYDYYNTACDRNEAFACFGLAELFFYGKGIPVDLAKAKALYQKACALKEPESCEKAAKMK